MSHHNSSSSSSASSGKGIARGKALLMERLKDIKFQKSQEGVLLIVFNNGEVFFYPLSDQTLNLVSGAKVITKDPSSTSGKSSSDKYSVYDVSHSLSSDVYKVFTLSFLVDPLNMKSCVPPRKILLSPNKRMLLVIGVLHRGQNCLVVYEISEPTPTRKEYFKLVFYDLCMMFIDACFTPDSKGLIVIPSRFPSYLFVLNLPSTNGRTFEKLRSISYSVDSAPPACSNYKEDLLKKPVSYEPRFVGPLEVFGPAKGFFGQPLKMTHIMGNSVIASDTYHFVTWNDDGIGEFCLWYIPRFADTDAMPADTHEAVWFKFSPMFSYSPRLLHGIRDRSWLEESNTPKHYILDIRFNRKDGKALGVVVRRENYERKADNGIGLQIFEACVSKKSSDFSLPPWYQITDELVDYREILTAKWSKTLLLGTHRSFAILVKGKGLFELVDYQYGSGFQYLYDLFTNTASSFCQVGRFRRFWVSLSGDLRMMIVKPEQLPGHPEWREVFLKSKNEILNMRMLGRRIGYFIVDILQDAQSNTLESIYNSTKKGKKSQNQNGLEINPKECTGEVEAVAGIHLYKCWQCRRSLLKPLQCGACKCVAYCSKTCQKEHWPLHKGQCREMMDLFD